MSLIDDFMEDCTIVNKLSLDDGEGGFETVWSDGATIKAAITHNSSMQAKRAEQEGVTSTYTVTTDKEIQLEFHTVIRRDRDGAIFRVTSNDGDRVTPKSSTLNMAQVDAEKWSIPNE